MYSVFYLALLQRHHPYRAPQECFLSPTVALVGPASQPPAICLTLSRPLQQTRRVVDIVLLSNKSYPTVLVCPSWYCICQLPRPSIDSFSDWNTFLLFLS